MAALLQISPVNALLLILILCFIWMMYRFNRNNREYNVVDMLMGSDGRASTTNHIYWAFALLSMWVVVDRELKSKDDISTILLGVLGIFVAKQAATQIAETMNKPDAPSTTTSERTVKTTETVQADPPKPTKGKR